MNEKITGQALGEKLLQSVKEMKAGKAARVHTIEVSEIVEARNKLHMSQEDFAMLLRISKRTLQDWEQGRREPQGPAVSLLKIAFKRPDILKEVLLKDTG